MKKAISIVCMLFILLLAANFCHAAGPWHGPGPGGPGYWHGSPHAYGGPGGYWYGPPRGYWGPRYGFSGAVVVVPGAPFLPPYAGYPPYPAASAYCDTRCYDRVVPVCRYDRWGDRWCYDRVVRECSRYCY